MSPLFFSLFFCPPHLFFFVLFLRTPPPLSSSPSSSPCLPAPATLQQLYAAQLAAMQVSPGAKQHGGSLPPQANLGTHSPPTNAHPQSDKGRSSPPPSKTKVRGHQAGLFASVRVHDVCLMFERKFISHCVFLEIFTKSKQKKMLTFSTTFLLTGIILNYFNYIMKLHFPNVNQRHANLLFIFDPI